MASIVEIVSYFNNAKQQAIVWHQQTEVYAEHKTLNEFYDEIVDLLDDLSESYAGIYGRLTPYSVEDLQDWTSTEDTIKYFQAVYQMVQTERKSLYQETWIQNQIDEIAALVAQTIYLLTMK